MNFASGERTVATVEKISFFYRLSLGIGCDHDITMDHKSSSWLLTETDVAKMLSVSLAALRRWRIEDRGPRCLKIGSLVRYRLRDVESWLESRPLRGEPAAVNATARRKFLGRSGGSAA